MEKSRYGATEHYLWLISRVYSWRPYHGPSELAMNRRLPSAEKNPRLRSDQPPLSPRAANVHFEDHLEDGKMSFSYRMQTGVVRKSNALALMRAVGLKV